MMFTGCLARLDSRRKSDQYQTYWSLKFQDELLDLIEELPVCVGLGVRADVSKIEEFYSIIAGRPVKMRGFVDLAVLAVIAGWKMNAVC